MEGTEVKGDGICMTNNQYYEFFIKYSGDDTESLSEQKAKYLDHIKGLSKTGKLLEIGAGAGAISAKCQKDFSYIELIEPNPCFMEVIKKRFSNYNQNNLKIINQFFDKYQVTQKFDLVMLSHVLYHVDKSKRKDFIKKAFECVDSTNGGVLSINSLVKEGKHYELIEKYDTENSTSHSDEIQAYLNELGNSFTIERNKYTVRFSSGDVEKDFEDCFEYVYFYVVECGFDSSVYNKLSLEEYHHLETEMRKLTWNLRKEDGSFEFLIVNDYIDVFSK